MPGERSARNGYAWFMEPMVQLIVVMPFVVVFGLIVVALWRQENQRFHSLEAAYRRRHAVRRTRAYSPVVRPGRVEDPAQSHDAASAVRHAA